MEPVGLIFKNIKENPYTGRISAELMIAHLCQNCGVISCNRTAGDDNSHIVISLLEKPNSINQKISNKLANQGIKLLTQCDKKAVLISLLGYNYQKYLK